MPEDYPKDWTLKTEWMRSVGASHAEWSPPAIFGDPGNLVRVELGPPPSPPDSDQPTTQPATAPAPVRLRTASGGPVKRLDEGVER